MNCKCVECGSDATCGSMRHPYCDSCFMKVWGDNINAYREWLDNEHGHERIMPIVMNWIVHQKCLLHQGAIFVQIGIIFFMGSVSAQEWCRRHFDVTPNILWFIGASVLSAWCLGAALYKSGWIRAEQTWYAKNNDVFSALRSDTYAEKK